MYIRLTDSKLLTSHLSLEMCMFTGYLLFNVTFLLWLISYHPAKSEKILATDIQEEKLSII